MLLWAGTEVSVVREAAGAVAAAAAVLLLLLLLAADDAAGGTLRSPADAAADAAGGVGGCAAAYHAASAAMLSLPVGTVVEMVPTGISDRFMHIVIWIINSSVLCVRVILQTKTNMCTHPT